MKSEYQEYCDMLDNMALILNKNIIDRLKFKLAKVENEIRIEEKQNAMELCNISEIAIEIDKKLNELTKEKVKYKDHPALASLHIKCFYKWLLKKI